MRHAAKHAGMTWLDSAEFALRRSPPPLDTDEVHLWLWRDAAARGREGESAALQRLRCLLGAYVGAAPAALDLRREAYGKPRLDLPGAPGFNLSHSGDCVAAVVAAGVDPGVDVELPRRSRAYLGLAQRYFDAGEAAALAGLCSDKREAAFHALWTGKEAVLKADGRGLAYGLQRVVFELDAAGQPLALLRVEGAAGPADAWQVHHFLPAVGGHGAVAWRGPPRRIRAYRLDG